MAVGHDADSESHTGTVGSTNEASFQWDHPGTSSARGVLVFVCAIAGTNPVTGVTYGGIAMTAVSGGEASDTATEPGNIKTYFLKNPPTGTQTVVVSRTNNATGMYAVACTVTCAADRDPEVHTAGIVLLNENGTFAEQSVTDGSPGSNSLRYAQSYYGGNSPAPQGSSSTLLQSIDAGSFGFSTVRETTAGQGARNVGFTQATSDDRAGVHLAIKEVVGPMTGSAAGGSTCSGSMTGAGALAGSAAGVATVGTPILTPDEGMQAWYDASKAGSLWQDDERTTAADDDAERVASFDDLSGYGRHSQQATDGNRATLKKAIQNGLDVVRFDGASHFLETTAWENDHPVYIVAVVIPRNPTLGFVFGRATVDNRLGLVGDTTNGWRQVSVNAGTHRGTLTEDAAAIIGSAYDAGTSCFLRVGATEYGAEDLSTDQGGAGLRLGRNGGAGTDYLDADICEVRIYSPIPGSSKRTAIQQALDAKWIPPAGAMTGSAAGGATASGTLLGAGALEGSTAGVGAAAGTLGGAGALAGSAAGTSSASAEGIAYAFGTGSAAGAATVTGALTGAGALAGAVAGAATAAGSLTGAGALAGAAAGVGSAAGELLGSGALAGAAAGQATVTGDLEGGVPGMTGSAAGGATASGALTGAGALAGTSAAAAAAAGELTGVGALTGTSSATATVAGVLVGTGALAGTAAGGATATGELTALGAGVDLDRPLTVAAVSVGLTSAASIDRGIAEVRSETVGVGSMEGVEGP